VIRRSLKAGVAGFVFMLGSMQPVGAGDAGKSQPASLPPQQGLLDELRSLLAREPRHVGALYTAARTAAGAGDHAQAAAWLDRLEEVGLGDELDADDFGPFAQTSAYRERAARFASAAPPIGTAAAWAETSCADLLPEGTAWDAKRGVLLVSSGRQRAVFAVDRRGTCRRLTPVREDRLLAVLGMLVDARSDSLWVATTAAPFMIDAAPADAASARLTQIDLASGAIRSSYRLGDGAMLNDLAMTSDGTIYVTESRADRIYRLRPGAAQLAPLTTDRAVAGPNGIIALAGGDLLVADFHGLLRLRPEPDGKARVTRLATPGGSYLGGIDGLARHGSQVIGIQNLVGRSRIWAITLDPHSPAVAEARVLLRGHPDFLNPTTGAIAGGQLLFVADTKLQKPLPSGALSALPAGRTGHRILAIDLAAARK
jgi:hypothetical protein